MEKESAEIVEIEVQKTTLELLKDAYEVLQKEYNLPEFEELNKDFSIEKINEEETEYLAREIRRYMTEKINGYLRIVETFLHPNNAQMFVFTILKSTSEEHMKKLKSIYSKLAKKEIEILELDLEFNLEKEITFIKDTFQKWQEIKHDLLPIIQQMKADWKTTNNNGSRDRNYFG